MTDGIRKSRRDSYVRIRGRAAAVRVIRGARNDERRSARSRSTEPATFSAFRDTASPPDGPSIAANARTWTRASRTSARSGRSDVRAVFGTKSVRPHTRRLGRHARLLRLARPRGSVDRVNGTAVDTRRLRILKCTCSRHRPSTGSLLEARRTERPYIF